MKTRIFRSLFLIAALSALLSTLLVSWLMYDRSLTLIKNDVAAEAGLIANAYQQIGAPYLSSIKKQLNGQRLTLIDANGQVLYDSQADQQSLANHNDRTEIIMARQQGQGEAIRYSDTLDTQTIYNAILLEDGVVLRISVTTYTAWRVVIGAIPYMLLICLLMFLLAALLAKGQTRRIIAPINAIDPEYPFQTEGYEELAPLLLRLAKQNQQIDQQISELSRQKDEFSSISQHMREGLLVVNSFGYVLTANRSALLIFDANAAQVLEKPIFQLTRALPIQKTMEKLTKLQEAEEILEQNGHTYQILATPITENDTFLGGVLLLVDISEKTQNEQLRREFSANVSHELKTPLTAISGYAEIIENGLAKAEDHQAFATKIRQESTRLLQLIEDIIQLSSLDEAVENRDIPKEPVALLALAREVLAGLQPLADQNQIALELTGEEALLFGNKRILNEILYNLAENAIKYNRPNGRVSVKITPLTTQILLQVRDTGIGIPAQYQERVFERFFRVDKSRSKKIGGTGLGLSIVKHGAAFHQAQMKLSSQVDQGTCVELLFPRLLPTEQTAK